MPLSQTQHAVLLLVQQNKVSKTGNQFTIIGVNHRRWNKTCQKLLTAGYIAASSLRSVNTPVILTKQGRNLLGNT